MSRSLSPLRVLLCAALTVVTAAPASAQDAIRPGLRVRGEMKPLACTPEQIERATARRYRPGLAR